MRSGSMKRGVTDMAHGGRLSRRSFLGLSAGAAALAGAGSLAGCGSSGGTANGVRTIKVISYKQEAVEIFDRLQEEFNATHTDFQVQIDSPSNATTVMRTSFIRGDWPDIVGIGGDMSFASFVDAGIIANVEDYPRIDEIKQSYLDILSQVQFVPMDGIYGVPYAANAAGILYNRQMFREHGWEIPVGWTELLDLCEQIRSEGILPFYFGFKDTWTCLAPWNALAVEFAPSDLFQQVNEGKAKFSDYYREPAEKLIKLVSYGEEGPVAYSYNMACTAFANGEAAMYPIGSYAVPQVLSVNPDMDMDSFVMPGSDDPSKLVLNSGVDLMFCVMDACEDKRAAYEVIDFLSSPENLQTYLDDQNAVPCEEGDFRLSGVLDGMSEYIGDSKVADYQDHHYPTGMDVSAMVQTMIMDADVDAFLNSFDDQWSYYDRDVIAKVKKYNEEHGEGGSGS